MLVTHAVPESYMPDHSNPQPSFKLQVQYLISSPKPPPKHMPCFNSMLFFVCLFLCCFFLKQKKKASVGKPDSQFLQDYIISSQQYNATLKWSEPVSSDASCLHHPSDGNCCLCSLWILASKWQRASSVAGRAVKDIRNSSPLPFIPTANAINAPVMLRQTWLQSGVPGSLCPI